MTLTETSKERYAQLPLGALLERPDVRQHIPEGMKPTLFMGNCENELNLGSSVHESTGGGCEVDIFMLLVPDAHKIKRLSPYYSYQYMGNIPDSTSSDRLMRFNYYYSCTASKSAYYQFRLRTDCYCNTFVGFVNPDTRRLAALRGVSFFGENGTAMLSTARAAIYGYGFWDENSGNGFQSGDALGVLVAPDIDGDAVQITYFRNGCMVQCVRINDRTQLCMATILPDDDHSVVVEFEADVVCRA